MLSLIQRRFKLASGEDSWTWQISGTCPYTGEPVSLGTRTRNKKVAEDRLRIELDRRREAAVNGGALEAHNFAAGVVEYLAKGGEDQYLTPLLEHFGKMPLREIRDTHISAFCAERYPDAKASTLVRQVYGPMQWVMNAAARAELCPPRTFTKPTVKKEPAKYARSDDWLIKVLGACTNLEQRCALLFMSFSGARATEVVEVLVRDYNPRGAVIALSRTKGNKERLVALPLMVNEALQILLARRQRADSDRLFGYASRYSLVRILRRSCARAGVEYLSPHKAGRHSFAARLMRDGASLKELQRAGGWADLGVVARTYAHLERDMVDAKVREVATDVRLENVAIAPTVASAAQIPLLKKPTNSGDT